MRLSITNSRVRKRKIISKVGRLRTVGYFNRRWPYKGITSTRRVLNEVRRPRWKNVVKRVFVIGLIFFLLTSLIGLVLASAYVSKVSREIPDPGTPFATQFNPQTTYIYDRDGKMELYKIYGQRNSEWIKITEVPPHVKAAFLASEDASFYQHKGLDLPGIIKAVLHEVFGIGHKRGASTITQQLIQNGTSIGREQTYERKVKELILSMQIEQKYTKDQILEAYLNYIPFGGNIYGIKVASKSYFGKEPKDLTLAEAALLAGIPQFPSTYAPPPRGTNPSLTAYQAHAQLGYPYDPDSWLSENVKDEDLQRLGITDRKDFTKPANEWRMEYVLYQIKDKRHVLADQAGCNCAITDEQIEEAKKQPITFTKYYEQKYAGHFVDYVRNELALMFKDKGGISYVEGAGFKVYTTLDWDMQQIGEQEVKNIRGDLAEYRAYNAALVSIDPNTGEILTMVGSRDYWGGDEGCDAKGRCKFNGQTNALTSLRSYGSSGKPFVYLAFFMKGFGVGTNVPDIPLQFGNYKPMNYERGYKGIDIDVRRALALSRNIPAVLALSAVGMEDYTNLLSKLGYTDETIERIKVAGLAAAIGGASITMLEHAHAYATLATGGIYHPLSCIKKIIDRNGNIVYENIPDKGTRVVDEKYTYLVTNILQDYWTLPPVKKQGYYVAGKTGTSDGPTDIVFGGYSRNLVTVVWAGNNDNSTLLGSADGATVAKGIWNPYMLKVLPKFPNEPFKQPAGVVRATVCKDTGFSPGNSGCTTKSDLFIEGYLPPEDTYHQTLWVSKCPDVYKLASEADKVAGVAEKKSFVHYQSPNPALQPQIDKYLADRGMLAPTETCEMYRGGGDTPIVNFISPSSGQVFHVGDTVNMQAAVGTPKGIVYVDYYVDGILVKHSTAPPYNAQWTIDSSVTAGIHTLKAYALDSGGKTGSGTVVITVEKQLPSLQITSPTDGSTAPKPKLNVVVAVGETPLVESVSVDIYTQLVPDGPVLKLAEAVSINVGSSKTIECNIAELITGKEYKLWATAKAGVDSITSAPVFVTIADPV